MDLGFKLINHATHTTLHATAKGRTRFLPARTWIFFTGRCIIRIKIGMASCISCHYKSGDLQFLLLLQRKFCFKFVCCSHCHFQAVRSTETRCSFGVAGFHICLDASTSWQVMQGKYSVSRLFLIFSFILNIQSWNGLHEDAATCSQCCIAIRADLRVGCRSLSICASYRPLWHDLNGAGAKVHLPGEERGIDSGFVSDHRRTKYSLGSGCADLSNSKSVSVTGLGRASISSSILQEHDVLGAHPSLCK